MKTESKYCLIVTGGSVDQNLLATVYEGAYGYPVHPYVIGVDKGLEMLEQLDIEPDLIIGDFDSANDGIRAKYVTSPDAVVRRKVCGTESGKRFHGYTCCSLRGGKTWIYTGIAAWRNWNQTRPYTWKSGIAFYV